MRAILFILTISLFVGCVPALNIKFNKPNKIISPSISSVQIINHQLVINGAGLSDVTNVVVNGNSLSENFSIESKTNSKITANSNQNFSFDASKIFNLIISDANASATFQIDFSLCNATMGAVQFDCDTTPTDNDVLVFDQGVWTPKPLGALGTLVYKGTWDANTTLPIATSVGQYYIITASNLPTYELNDWIVWNGSSYDVVHQSAVSGVSSFKGRVGAVVPLAGDYDLAKMTDVDFSVAPTPGQVLKFVGGKWIADDDDVGSVVGAGTITTAELANGSVTDAKIVGMATSKLTGTISSAQIADGAIVDADISGAAAIAYSKLSIANGDIPAEKIATGVVSNAEFNWLDGVTSSIQAQLDAKESNLPTGGTTAQYFAGNKSLQTLNTAAVPESGTNYYFTDTRARGARLTGLASASGALAATDSVLEAFGKLLGTQGDYVSKSANSTILGSITIDNTVGELHVPTLPTVGADLTQAASVGYVQNYVTAAADQWDKNGLDLNYVVGNVGIGTTTPDSTLHVAGQITADAFLLRGDMQTFGWDANVYNSFSSTLSTPDGAGIHVNNANELDGSVSLYTGASINTAGTTQKYYMGSVANNTGYAPTIVFGQRTGNTAYSERMRISANGNVGIGTDVPGRLLSVNGEMEASAVYTTVLAAATSNVTQAIASNLLVLGGTEDWVVSQLRNTHADGISGTAYLNATGVPKGFSGYGNPGAPYFPDSVFLSTADHLTPLILGVQGIEAMKINVDGGINMGAAAPALTYRLTVANGGVDITSGGVRATTAYNQTSDIRLKTHIDLLDSKNALEKITSLNGIYYDWKDQEKMGFDRQLGLSAQDVEKVFPEAVKTDSKGFLSVGYSTLIAPVIEAIKELNKRVVSLFKVTDGHSRAIASIKSENAAKDQKIKKLEAENAEMKARLDKIEKMLNKSK